MYDKNKSTTPQGDSNPNVGQNSYFAYLNEISQYELLTVDEEISLFQRIQAGDNVAKDLFIKSNLRLVVKEARKYYIPGLNDLLDLIQEGNIGLMKAVEQFDVSKGCKFSTFAVSSINRAIQAAPSRADLPLEMPRNKRILINKIQKAIDLFEQKYYRKPSCEELSKELNVSVNTISILMPFIIPTVSLSSKLYPNNDTDAREVMDVFEEHYKEEPTDPESQYIIKETKNAFREIIDEVLNEKEKYILFSYRGLFGFPQKSVATLTKELNMSQQGIQQSEKRSIKKLSQRFRLLNLSSADFT